MPTDLQLLSLLPHFISFHCIHRIYILVSVVLVLLATLYEVRQIGRSSLRCWASTERNRPKSFIACFSARYNLEQVASVRDRHMYEMPPPPMPQQANSNININNNNSTTLSPGQQHQANININVSCADDSSTNDSSSETGISPKDYLGTGMGGVGGGVVGLHQSPVYGQVVNTASVDGLKVFALLWICMANFYLLGYQPQMLPSVGKWTVYLALCELEYFFLLMCSQFPVVSVLFVERSFCLNVEGSRSSSSSAYVPHLIVSI